MIGFNAKDCEESQPTIDLNADFSKFSKFSLPNIVDEVPFSIQIDDCTVIEFTELRFRTETFQVLNCQRSFKVVNQDILSNLGSKYFKDLKDRLESEN